MSKQRRCESKVPKCHGPGVCEAMQRDQETDEELRRTRRVTSAAKDAVARIMSAVVTGHCCHCKRAVR